MTGAPRADVERVCVCVCVRRSSELMREALESQVPAVIIWLRNSWMLRWDSARGVEHNHSPPSSEATAFSAR